MFYLSMILIQKLWGNRKMVAKKQSCWRRCACCSTGAEAKMLQSCFLKASKRGLTIG